MLHKCILSRWAWSAHWLAFNNCRLWDSSSRRDSNNAYSEFLRNFESPGRTWSDIIFSELNFQQEQLVELFVQGVLGDLVRQNRILCESENDSKYCSVDFSLTSTLHHWSQNLLFPFSRSLMQSVFPMHAFFAFYLKSKIIMRNVRNRGFKHCENIEESSVLVCVFREVRDFIEVWIVSLSTEVILSIFLGS